MPGDDSQRPARHVGHQLQSRIQPVGNMQFMMALASLKMKMTPEEAINAATINGAHAMDLSSRFGSITVGKTANVFITAPMPSYEYFAYAFTSPLIEKIILNGKLYHEDFAASQIFRTLLGTLTLVPTGHGAVFFKLNELVFYIDPYSETTDYSTFPKADMVLFTHDHYDHYDPKALKHLVTDKTEFIGPKCVEAHRALDKTLNNGDSCLWNGITIKAVPAYNIINKKPDGRPYHPKGYGNGYILTFGDFVVYVAGDTELIPEMTRLGHIDVAVLPKNLPFTMSDDQFVEAARLIGAPVVYPVHYFELDKEYLERQLGDTIKLNYE